MVRVPSRALNEAKAFSYEGFRFFFLSGTKATIF